MNGSLDRLGEALRCIAYALWACAALSIIYTEVTLPDVIERAVERSALPGVPL